MGATKRAILSQFLVEALFLCTLGGFLGVAAGYGAPEVMTRVAGWDTAVRLEAVIIGVRISPHGRRPPLSRAGAVR